MALKLEIGQIVTIKPTKEFEDIFKKIGVEERLRIKARTNSGHDVMVNMYKSMLSMEYIYLGNMPQPYENFTKLEEFPSRKHTSIWTVPDDFIHVKDRIIDIREYPVSKRQKLYILLNYGVHTILTRNNKQDRLVREFNLYKNPFKYLPIISKDTDNIPDLCYSYIKMSPDTVRCPYSNCNRPYGYYEFMKAKYVRHGSIFLKCLECGERSVIAIKSNRQGISFELTA